MNAYASWLGSLDLTLRTAGVERHSPFLPPRGVQVFAAQGSADPCRALRDGASQGLPPGEQVRSRLLHLTKGIKRRPLTAPVTTNPARGRGTCAGLSEHRKRSAQHRAKVRRRLGSESSLREELRGRGRAADQRPRVRGGHAPPQRLAGLWPPPRPAPRQLRPRQRILRGLFSPGGVSATPAPFREEPVTIRAAQAAHRTFSLLQRVHVGRQLGSPPRPRPHRSPAAPARPAAPTPTSNRSPRPSSSHRPLPRPAALIGHLCRPHNKTASYWLILHWPRGPSLDGQPEGPRTAGGRAGVTLAPPSAPGRNCSLSEPARSFVYS